MSETNQAKKMKSMLVAGVAAATAFAGFAAAPALFSSTAEAQKINPPSINPPGGAPGSFADLIARVSPAVVSIQVKQKPGKQAQQFDFENMPPGFEEFMRRFPERGPQRTPQALGSGFIIADNGTIVTNNHVVENADEITVRTSDGKELKADIVGLDENTDLAVLKVRGGGRFPYVAFDKTPSVRVGDWVVAVGNPFGLDGTATAGIVSAKGRKDTSASGSYVDFLQIDAPINRGNSGGPTFDLRGNVIGVNSAIFSPTGGNVGIGFAIPSDTASRVVEQLISSGHVSRAWLGVQIQAIDPEIAASLGLNGAKGAIIAQVTPKGPAEAAGLQQGDVILRINGQDVDDSRDLTRKVAQAPIGRDSRFDIQRNGQRRTVNVRLGERPSEQQLAGLDTDNPETAGPSAAGSVEAKALGLTVRPISDEDRRRLSLTGGQGGLIITKVADNSYLADHGINPGDIISGLGQEKKPLKSVDELNQAVEQARRDNRPVLLQVQRGSGPPRYIAVEVAKG